jgi:hypothetical protein
MDWRLKALAFRALDLPGGEHLHFWAQRYLLRSWPRPEKRLRSFPPRARGIIDDYVRHAGERPRAVLELGAGRDLALPLCLRDLGVETVIASDIERLAKLDLVRDAAARLLSEPPDIRGWDDVERYGIHYLAPHRVNGADPQVDCSCSNEVLEHVPAEQLPDLLKEIRRVTRGITIHSIDYSDHYARSDPSISRLNFLRYSDEEWARFNGRRHHVNRLRHSDYLRLFREAGFTILEESTLPGEDAPKQIADRFRCYDPAELCAIKGRIVAS